MECSSGGGSILVVVVVNRKVIFNCMTLERTVISIFKQPSLLASEAEADAFIPLSLLCVKCHRIAYSPLFTVLLAYAWTTGFAMSETKYSVNGEETTAMVMMWTS